MAASPRRADLEATLRTGGYVACWSTGRPQARGGRQRGGPRAPRAAGGRTPRRCSRWCAAPVRCSWAVRAGQRGRLRGRAQPRAAHRPHGPLRVGAARRRLPHPHPRRVARRRRPRPAGAARGRPRRGRGAARRTPESVRPCGARRDAPARSRMRPDLRCWTGYHSPQVDVEVRLNTNESPLPPPAAVARRAARRARPHRLQPLSRPRRHRAARRHGRAPRCATRAGVLRQRVQRGAAVPAARLRGPGRDRGGVRADLRAAQPHRRAHRHRRWCAGWRGPDHRWTSTPSTASSTSRHRSSRSCARPTTPRAAPSRPSRGARARAGAGTGRGGRGLRAVRPVERARAPRRRGRARTAGGGPDLLQDVVDGGVPPRLPRRRSRGGGGL